MLFSRRGPTAYGRMVSNVTEPLSARVQAAVLPVLDHPDVTLWRPATLGDVDSITVTQKAMDAADHPDWTTPREDIEDVLSGSHLDLGSDSIVALDPEGTVIAWGVSDLGPGQATSVPVYLTGGVHPAWRGRGVGRQLLGWQVARGRQHLAASSSTLPGWLRTDADERNPGAIALIRRHGLEIARYFTSMERDLSGSARPLAEERPLPDGVRLVPYAPELREASRLARNDAFRDHWGSQPSEPEWWSMFVDSPLFRNDLSWVAVADSQPDQVLALALCNVNPEDWPLQGFSSGYIALVGVVRERRGQGLAPAVLSAALRSIAGAGLDRAVLDVDTESPTGALGLYEGLGFVATTRAVQLVLEL